MDITEVGMGYAGWDEPARESRPEKDEDFEYEKYRQARSDAMPDLHSGGEANAATNVCHV
jgi:hypothetical protein